MKVFIAYCLNLIMMFSLQGQSNWEVASEILQENNGICIDKQQYVYIYYSNGFKKYTKEGQEEKIYQSKEIGELIHMDISPAGQILLLFKDMPSMVVLDKNFIEIGRINLSALNLNEVSLCMYATNGNIWVFNQTDRSITKLDLNGNIRQTSVPLNLNKGTSTYPTDMREDNNQIILSEPMEGIFVFDAYGKRKGKYNILGVNRIQPKGESFIYAQEGKVFSFNMTNFIKEEIPLPETNMLITQAYLLGKVIIVGNNKKMQFLKLKG